MAMTFQLKDFDGPLDLLLFLINKEKIDIKDIFVSQITDQYIDSVRNAPDLDMDDATDFLVMAATLLEIKSRAMLPRPPPAAAAPRPGCGILDSWLLSFRILSEENVFFSTIRILYDNFAA